MPSQETNNIGTATSSVCELNDSIWIQASSSPAGSKALNTAHVKVTPSAPAAAADRNQNGRKVPKDEPTMPAILKGTKYEARWTTSSGPPNAMPCQPPLGAPVPASPSESTSPKATPVVRKSFFLHPAQSDNLLPIKSKVPDFLNNDMGPKLLPRNPMK